MGWILDLGGPGPYDDFPWPIAWERERHARHTQPTIASGPRSNGKATRREPPAIRVISVHFPPLY